MSYCNVWAEVVFCGFPKKEMFTQILLCLFCVLPNSIMSLSFRCWSIPVSEIREFNRKKKKKMNNSNSGYFRFDTFPTVQMDPVFNQT